MILPTWVLCFIGAFFVIAISITGSCLVASYMDDGLVAKLQELETKLEKLEKSEDCSDETN